MIRRWSILSILGLFFFMVIVDGTIVSIALPTIAKSLEISTSATTSIIGIYLVTISALILFFGQLGDQMGRTNVFIWGTIVFVAGSAISGIGISLPLVLVGRFCQAIGASMTMANSYAIVTDTFPSQYLGRALGIESVFISLGALVGPGLGGLILSYLPWGYIFWVNVPLGLVCIGVEMVIFPRKKVTNTFNLDWGGVAYLSVMATAFFIVSVVVLSHIVLALISLVIFFIALIYFVRHENRAHNPLLEMRLLLNLRFAQALIGALISFIVSYFFTLLAPIYLQVVLKYSTGFSGVLLMTAPIIALIANPVAGILTDRYNPNVVMRIGLAILIISQFGLVMSDGQNEPIVFITISVILSIGTAVFGTPNNTIIMQSVSDKQRGMAGSMNSLMREFGLMLGTTLSTLIFYARLSMLDNRSVATALGQSSINIIKSQQTAYLVALFLLLIGLLIVSRKAKRTSTN